jgi:serine phosphatase RsbU (regulator of sigma subunit)
LVNLKGSKKSVWNVMSLPIDFSSSTSVKRYALIILLFIILSSIALIILIALRIIHPIQALSNRMRRLLVLIEEQKEIDFMKVKNNDEIKTLVHNFNHVSANVQLAYDELTGYCHKLERKLNDRKEEVVTLIDKLKKTSNELSDKDEKIYTDTETTSIIQKSLLPDSHIVHDKFEILSKVIPLTKTSSDYIDVWEVDKDRHALLVIDVSGHSVPSAMVTAMAKMSFQYNSKVEENTAKVCSNVNMDLYSCLSSAGLHFTAFFCIYNYSENTLEYTNAGHPPSIVINKEDATIDSIDTVGYGVGIAKSVLYEHKVIKLDKKHRLFMYSDGITSTRIPKSSNFYGENGRFSTFLSNNYNIPPNEFIDKLLKDVESFSNFAPKNDDISILVMDIK